MVSIAALSSKFSEITTKDVLRKVKTMKLFARIFALSLVVTGAVASTHLANASQPSAGVRVSALPVPTCDPSQSSCGIGSSSFNLK